MKRRVALSWTGQLAFGLSILLWPAVLSAEEHIVRIVSDDDNLRMTFEPRHLRIEPGDRVTWISLIEDMAPVGASLTLPDRFAARQRELKPPTDRARLSQPGRQPGMNHLVAAWRALGAE